MEHCHKIVPKETYNIDDILHKKSKMFSKMQKTMITNHCLLTEHKNKVDCLVCYATFQNRSGGGIFSSMTLLCNFWNSDPNDRSRP